MLPFVPERKVVDACAVMGPEHGWYEAYARRLEQILHFLTKDLTAEPSTCSSGHLLVSRGALWDGGAPAPPRRHLRGQRGAASGQRAVRGPRPPPSAAGAPGAGQDLLLRLPHRARLRRARAGQARGADRREAGTGGARSNRRRSPRAGACATSRAPWPSCDAWPPRWAPISCGSRVKAEAPTPGLADEVRELLANALEVTVDYPRQATRPRPRARATAPSSPRSSSRGSTRRRTAPSPGKTSEEALRRRVRRGPRLRPLRLELEGFTSFKERLALDFDGPRPLCHHRSHRRRQVVARSTRSCSRSTARCRGWAASTSSS